MCPPPSEPIRPIGPVAGEVYVEPSALAERVARRGRRGRDEDQPRDGREPAEDEEPPVPDDWFQTEAPLKAAGGYDDHGRTATTDPVDATRPHVDKTA